LSGDDEEQQHCTGDEHGAHSEAPCLRRVETAGQREEDRQRAERIEHDEQRHELVEEALHQRAVQNVATIIVRPDRAQQRVG